MNRCNVIISNNKLTKFGRYINVSGVDLVINFDLPILHQPDGYRRGDPESYIKRIGLTSRFGSKGIAVTIYDPEEDKKYLDEIT
jgi:superfamily II DNA/RNA helicase